MDLYDVVEFRYDPYIKKFRFIATHHYNIPKKMAYGLKQRLVAQRASIKVKDQVTFLPNKKVIDNFKFKVVPNGTQQYSNQFKTKKINASMEFKK